MPRPAPRWWFGLAAIAVGCAGASSTPAAPSGTGTESATERATESASAAATPPEPTTDGEGESETESTREGESSAGEAAAPAPRWAVTLLANEGVWSMEALGADAIVLLVHAHTPQAGYDPEGTLHLLEVRDRRSFALRWRAVQPDNVSAVVASEDGTRIAVLGVQSTRVISASDGATLFTLPGYAIDAAFDERGGLVRATRTALSASAGVEIVDPSGAPVRTLALPGSAPSTIHAMMTDGECQTIYTEDAAHVTSLAAARGTIAVGASDGSIRLHRDGEADGAEVRLTRADVREYPGGAVTAVRLALRAPDELVAVYSDGSLVRWDTRTHARRATVRGECTAAELARIAVLEGLPGDVEECGGTGRAAIEGEHVVLAGGSGARIRTLSGRRLAGFPTLHGNGIVISGDEVWLAGTDAVVERWSLDGRFRGVHRAGTGWAHVVALSERHVAITGAGEGEVHGQESEGARPTAIWRIADGTRVGGMDDVRGGVRFVGERVLVTLADGTVVVRSVADARELVRFRAGPTADAGLGSISVPIVPAHENAVVVASGRVHLVTEREVRDVGVAPPEPDVGVASGWYASADGTRLVRLVFAPVDFAFRLEAYAVGSETRLLFSRDRVGEHVAISRDGSRVITSSRGGVAQLVDGATGASLPMPEVDASWAGFDPAGHPCVHSRELYARLSCVIDGRLVPVGPWLLSPQSLEPLGARMVATGLGGGAYVLDGSGRTLAHVGAVAGDGFAITTPQGLVVTIPGAHEELVLGDGASPSGVARVAASPGRWREILGLRSE